VRRLVLFIVLMAGCSGKEPAAPDLAKPAPVTAPSPTMSPSPSPSAEPAAKSPLTFTIKGVSAPDKITRKFAMQTQTWRPKKGRKFVAVETEVTFDRCDDPPLKAPKGAMVHALDAMVEVCEERLHGCLDSMEPKKLRKDEARSTAPENSATLSSAHAFLVAGTERLAANGGKWGTSACADCQVIAHVRCAAARTPTPYTFYFNADAAFDPKTASLEIEGNRQALPASP
jgi:hypothetical protein